MYRGTTPTLTFQMPFEVSTIDKLQLAFSQDNNVILLKSLEDFTLNENTLILKLTEQDTLLFDDKKEWVEMQFRISIDDNITASRIIKTEVKRILCDTALNEVPPEETQPNEDIEDVPSEV